MVESPSLEVFKSCGDAALRDVVCGHGGLMVGRGDLSSLFQPRQLTDCLENKFRFPSNYFENLQITLLSTFLYPQVKYDLLLNCMGTPISIFIWAQLPVSLHHCTAFIKGTHLLPKRKELTQACNTVIQTGVLKHGKQYHIKIAAIFIHISVFKYMYEN